MHICAEDPGDRRTVAVFARLLDLVERPRAKREGHEGADTTQHADERRDQRADCPGVQAGLRGCVGIDRKEVDRCSPTAADGGAGESQGSASRALPAKEPVRACHDVQLSPATMRAAEWREEELGNANLAWLV